MRRCRFPRRRNQIYMMVCAENAGCSYRKFVIMQKAPRYGSTPPRGCRIYNVCRVKASLPAGSLSLRVTLSANSFQTCQCCCVTGVVKVIDFQMCHFISSVEGRDTFSLRLPRHSLYLSPSAVPGKHRLYNVSADDTAEEDSGLDANLAPGPTAGARLSRMARTEAQEALMEYLHSTRGLSYTDAEHISKNSPVFLGRLLAKVVDEEHARQDVCKFLQYNPINEFEPFFESLGLKPSEIQSLLPRHQFFLHNDSDMLHNFHVLCNFGIPRCNIGKMLKEAPEIFKYDFGTLEARIHAYINVGLSASTVIKLVSCCPSLLVGDVNQECVQVLEKLKGLGFGHFWIRGCLVEKKEYCWGKMLRMMEFLMGMGCSKENLRDLIMRNPWFLFNESGKVYMVAALLLKLGLKMDQIQQLLLHCPRILSGSFVKNLHRSVNFLFEIGMTTDEVAEITYSHPLVMGLCIAKESKSMPTCLNADREFLRNLIANDPHKLGDLASKANLTSMLATCNRSHPLEKTRFLLKLGFQENTEEMVIALDQFNGRGDLLQERFDVLLSSGLDFNDACNIVRRAPRILSQSADVLKKKINYIVKCAGYPLNSFLACPTCLCYNLDNIRLRVSLVHWLKQRGVVDPSVTLGTILGISTKRFERYFINRVPDGPDMWKKLKEACSS